MGPMSIYSERDGDKQKTPHILYLLLIFIIWIYNIVAPNYVQRVCYMYTAAAAAVAAVAIIIVVAAAICIACLHKCEYTRMNDIRFLSIRFSLYVTQWCLDYPSDTGSKVSRKNENCGNIDTRMAFIEN